MGLDLSHNEHKPYPGNGHQRVATPLLAWMLASVALTVALTGCPSSTEIRDRTPDEEAIAAVAHDCLGLLELYRTVDLETASESELERQMEEALLNEDVCANALRTSFRGAGSTTMANHLARALPIHALEVELVLSQRFDNMGGYCAILEELVRTLGADLEEVDAGLMAADDEATFNALLPLRELTVQSLQLSILDYADTCN